MTSPNPELKSNKSVAEPIQPTTPPGYGIRLILRPSKKSPTTEDATSAPPTITTPPRRRRIILRRSKMPASTGDAPTTTAAAAPRRPRIILHHRNKLVSSPTTTTTAAAPRRPRIILHSSKESTSAQDTTQYRTNFPAPPFSPSAESNSNGNTNPCGPDLWFGSEVDFTQLLIESLERDVRSSGISIDA
ncbi:hypothetical protein QQZ08_000086 [Neonectria magnoliae]|uniref:Uncharacterized protein n=1 Tax=Neonectria magnoliae TaxID=2732573 RepID=A0ABR1IHN5_9HYPO